MAVMNVWAKQKGFTIVELLIVIVVIAILAAITIVSYNGVQSRAKDSSRDSGAKTIRTVLELYKADNGGYPNACGGVNIGCNVTNLASFLVPAYTSSLPNDPDTSTSFLYVLATGNQGYGLRVNYQTKAQCQYQVGSGTNPSWWSGLALC